jgi:hypothetical protein
MVNIGALAELFFILKKILVVFGDLYHHILGKK